MSRRTDRTQRTLALRWRSTVSSPPLLLIVIPPCSCASFSSRQLTTCPKRPINRTINNLQVVVSFQTFIVTRRTYMILHSGTLLAAVKSRMAGRLVTTTFLRYSSNCACGGPFVPDLSFWILVLAIFRPPAQANVEILWNETDIRKYWYLERMRLLVREIVGGRCRIRALSVLCRY